MCVIKKIFGYNSRGNSILREELVELSIVISDKELLFLKRMTLELNSLQRKENSFEEAVHECIRMAMYEENEEKDS